LAGELALQIVQNAKRQYYSLACRRFGQAGWQQPGENRIATIDSLGFCLIFLQPNHYQAFDCFIEPSGEIPGLTATTIKKRHAGLYQFLPFCYLGDG
jgi:hypothetical protein